MWGVYIIMSKLKVLLMEKCIENCNKHNVKMFIHYYPQNNKYYFHADDTRLVKINCFNLLKLAFAKNKNQIRYILKLDIF